MGSKEWNGFIIYQSSAPFLTKQMHIQGSLARLRYSGRE